MFPEVPVTTRAEVPAGVGPGGGGPGPTDELPRPREETSRARGKRNGNLTRQLRPVAIKLVYRRRQVARRTVSPHGIVFSLIRDCGQKAEPLVVVTTTWAFEAFVPSRVNDRGLTAQEAPAGRPAQLNTTT